MRISIIAAFLVVLLAAGTSNADLVFTQILNNRGFETTPNHGAGWTLTGSPAVGTVEYTDPGNFFLPGPLPVEAGHTGGWGIQSVANNVNLNPTGDTSLEEAIRNVNVETGWYMINASVWANVYDDSGGQSRARFQVLLDDVGTGFATSSLDNMATGAWTGWTKLTYTTETPVFVNSTIGVNLRMIVNGSGGWSQVVGDFFTLEVAQVPEPAAWMLTGGVSLAGIVVAASRRILRRQRA